MDVFRFDEEVSVPFTRHGSRFRATHLAADGSEVGVAVVHVPAGGLVVRRAATAPALLAVVAGEGWAAGRHGARRPLRPGRAVRWEAGEDGEAGSTAGLTAVQVEGAFEVHGLRVTVDIVVADPDPAWPSWFEEVRARVWPAVADVALRIDHVGSTSVPGLAAKPIIDMDVVVPTEEDVEPAIERLTALGYRWRGDLGVIGREAFAPPAAATSPPHHLYLVVEDNRAHLDHWLLRDLLREDADARERYAALKRRNVELAAGDMDLYVEAKARLVGQLLARARAERGLPAVTYWDPGTSTAS